MELGGRDKSAMSELQTRRWAEWPNAAPITYEFMNTSAAKSTHSVIIVSKVTIYVENLAILTGNFCKDR